MVGIYFSGTGNSRYLYNFNAFECAVKSLIAAARENNVEVIYVRHDDGAGAELTKGTLGFEIYEGFDPQPSEKIFDKTVNSSFKGTGLLEYLMAKNVQTVRVLELIVCYRVFMQSSSGDCCKP